MNLTVQLVSDPFLVDNATQPYYYYYYYSENESDHDEGEDHSFIVGNITFVTLASLVSEVDANAMYYYQYIIRGPLPNEVVNINLSNWTGEYPDVGDYQYTIHAIAKLNFLHAYHANVSGGFRLLGKLG